jgi:hypothetical protein
MEKSLYTLQVRELEHSGFTSHELDMLRKGYQVHTPLAIFRLDGIVNPLDAIFVKPVVKPVVKPIMSSEQVAERRAEFNAEQSLTGFSDMYME